MRISDWSSDVCSSDLLGRLAVPRERQRIDIHLTVARVDDVRSQRDLTAIVGGGNRLLLDDGFEDRWRVTHDAGDIIFLLRCSKRSCPTKPTAGQATRKSAIPRPSSGLVTALICPPDPPTRNT